MASTKERAVLAGGCFWGVQELLRKYDGVLSTRVGYSGGDVPNATYRNHGTHAEAIEIIFDPSRISYRKLLELFFQIHDPTTRNRQGNDIGTQYRSIILTHSDAQKATAEAVMKEIADSGIWRNKLVTQLEPITTFYEAEEDHHDYFARNPWTGYCQVVVAPKLSKFRKQFTDRLKK